MSNIIDILNTPPMTMLFIFLLVCSSFYLLIDELNRWKKFKLKGGKYKSIIDVPYIKLKQKELTISNDREMIIPFLKQGMQKIFNEMTKIKDSHKDIKLELIDGEIQIITKDSSYITKNFKDKCQSMKNIWHYTLKDWTLEEIQLVAFYYLETKITIYKPNPFY